METNNHQIVDYDAVLDAKFGKEGTPERAKAENEAYAFYTGQIIVEARKEAKMTQSELAKKVGTNKSYISKIENGLIEPGVGLFLRILNALGLKFDIVKPMPPSIPAPKICPQLTPCGRAAMPSFSHIKVKRNIPTGLPTTSPKNTPSIM